VVRWMQYLKRKAIMESADRKRRDGIYRDVFGRMAVKCVFKKLGVRTVLSGPRCVPLAGLPVSVSSTR
jgi:hypothetical protein